MEYLIILMLVFVIVHQFLQIDVLAKNQGFILEKIEELKNLLNKNSHQ